MYKHLLCVRTKFDVPLYIYKQVYWNLFCEYYRSVYDYECVIYVCIMICFFSFINYKYNLKDEIWVTLDLLSV